MKRLLLLTICSLYIFLYIGAQRADYGKLSPMLRSLVRSEQKRHMTPSATKDNRQVCAFVKVKDDGEQLLRSEGCKVLTRVGNICIASIPIQSISSLTRDSRILRIEARLHNMLHTDSVAIQVNAIPVYEGRNLPQAYTGKGVVMGIMDIGFDLTHPNFYDSTATDYRIKTFWDQLSADTIGSRLYVGREYTSRKELLALGHSRDGLDHSHGTHTLGIAAGSGYNTQYRGLAPESDICLVANAVTEDTVFIDSDDYYKYTFATDALGFKYIFDYAKAHNQPCVISFSEGSNQDFRGYDALYYEMLDSLVGPGRIIVSSAGNQGQVMSYFCKKKGEKSSGTFVSRYDNNEMTITLKSADDFDMRAVVYSDSNDTLTVSMTGVLQQKDSVLETQIATSCGETISILIEAYPSSFSDAETCYDVTFTSENAPSLGDLHRLSVEVIGTEAFVEGYRMNGSFITDSKNPALSAGEYTNNIFSPASAPAVICVGSTGYRQSIVNYLGETQEFVVGPYGKRTETSSVGPTYDKRIKPDVMAPGINVISSYSSFYMENHPNNYDVPSAISSFDFNGRTYWWSSNSGTSMSSPAVGGAIALWLQACPTLTPKEIMAVFERTCRHNEPELHYPNNYYGYGEIDVYRGLLDVLKIDKIEGISTTPTPANLRLCGNGDMYIHLSRPATQNFSVSVFTLSGQRIHRQTLPAGSESYTIQLPMMQKNNIYAVQINGGPEIKGSMLVRR